MDGSPLHCPNQISIVLRGESYVYDGSHSAEVMKKVKGPTQAELGWGALQDVYRGGRWGIASDFVPVGMSRNFDKITATASFPAFG